MGYSLKNQFKKIITFIFGFLCFLIDKKKFSS